MIEKWSINKRTFSKKIDDLHGRMKEPVIDKLSAGEKISPKEIDG